MYSVIDWEETNPWLVVEAVYNLEDNHLSFKLHRPFVLCGDGKLLPWSLWFLLYSNLDWFGPKSDPPGNSSAAYKSRFLVARIHSVDDLAMFTSLAFVGSARSSRCVCRPLSVCNMSLLLAPYSHYATNRQPWWICTNQNYIENVTYRHGCHCFPASCM